MCRSDAPRERETDPDQVERERPRREPELTRPLVAVHELPEQQPGRAERDDVERHEQLVAEEADAERDEGERGVCDEPRLAPEEPRKQRAEHERSDDRDGKLAARSSGASEAASRTTPTPA